jgi:hypothetical protein
MLSLRKLKKQISSTNKVGNKRGIFRTMGSATYPQQTPQKKD